MPEKKPTKAETNMEMWHALEETDPNFVKPITGKAYKGNSPHPTWLIKRLTEEIGPCGEMFGWYVIHEQYVEGLPHPLMVDGACHGIIRELMHELRIRFWWRRTSDPDGATNEFESYGSTKAFYRTRRGDWIHDEDAAKKSLTDAITKAVSNIGCAADIFLGRWDDNKYVAALEREYGSTPNNPVTPSAPNGSSTTDAF